MSIMKYIFSILLFTLSSMFMSAQIISQQSVDGLDIQSCKSEYVYEGSETTNQFFEVLVSLEPVSQYYEQTFFLNRLLKAEGFYFQEFKEDDLVSFYVSRELFSQIPVVLVHEFFDEANANQIFLTLEQKNEFLSMFNLSLPGKDWSRVSGYRVVQGPTDNALCEDAIPFCTGTNYTFPAGVNSGNGQTGPYYDCLRSTPNPAWYYMKILDPGSINIYMYSTPSKDIDFCCWGPFDDPYDACSQLTASKVVSCSYSPSSSETCNIPNGQTGEYYILIITNYSNKACNINFSQTGGTGTTDCTILPPEASSNSPVCEGDNIELYAASQNGASYHWIGPQGFNSTEQNPVIENVTQQNSGPYTLTITQAAGSSDTTIMVYVKQHPTGNIYGNDEICKGDEAYLFFDLTGATPWNIKYTDGQNIYEETTFLNEYSIKVSPATSSTFTLVEVKDKFCYAEEMTGEAVVDIHPEITTFNLEAICNEAFTHYTVSFLLSGGTQGTYQVTPPGTITPGATADIFTSDPIEEGTPFSFSIVDDFDCDPVIVSGVKACDCPAYGSIVGEDTICSGQSTDIVIDLAGDAPWTVKYTANGGEPVIIDNITETPYYLTVNPLETTEYKLTYVGDIYCDGTAVGSATVYVFPQPTSIYSYEGICESEETTFLNDASIPNPGNIISYHWDFDDNGASSTEENPIYTFSAYGDFDVSLSVTSDEGCVDTYTETISVAQRVEPDAGEDQLITYGAVTTLEGSVSGGSGDYSYQWQPSYLVIDPNNLSTQTENLYDEQTFFLIATDNVSGCVGENGVHIELDGYPLSSEPESNPPQACYGQGIQLKANAFGGTESYTYSWTSDPQGYNFEIADPAIPSLTQSTTFTLTVNDGFNDFQKSIYVPVNPNPVISAGEDFAIDHGYVAELHCETIDGGSSFNFYGDPEEKIATSPYMQSPTTTNLNESTNFKVTATNEFGCATDDNIFVTVEGGPLSVSPYFEADKICHLDSIILYSAAGGGGGVYEFLWTVDPGTWTSTEQNPEFFMAESGDFTFTVEVKDDYNSITDTFNLTINALPEVNLAAPFDSLVSEGVVAVCVYDSVYLDATRENAEYLWSNGGTGSGIHVGTTGVGASQQDYNVLITDKNTRCSYNAEISIIYSFAMCSYFIEELNSQILEVEIYPNPVTDKVTISVNGVKEETRIVINDLVGRKQVYEATIEANETSFNDVINISSYPAGVYVVTFISGDASHSQKIIKTVTE